MFKLNVEIWFNDENTSSIELNKRLACFPSQALKIAGEIIQGVSDFDYKRVRVTLMRGRNMIFNLERGSGKLF